MNQDGKDQQNAAPTESTSATASGTNQTKLTKAERRALFEAERAAKGQKSSGGSGAGAGAGGGGAKPKLTKAERRAKQEAQRAAKGQKSDGGGGGKKKKGAADGGPGGKGGNAEKSNDGKKSSSAATAATGNRSNSSNIKEGNDVSKDKTLNFFSHLPPYKDHNTMKKEFSGVILGSSKNSSQIHPSIRSLGLQFTTGTIRGANARARAMLYTFQKAIVDYQPSAKTRDIRSGLEHDVLKPSFNYLSTTCRTHSVTMGNAFTCLRKVVMDLERDLDLDTMKERICDAIEIYVQERISFADQAISKYARTKIVDGDVILTYAKSEVIEVLLLNAFLEEKKKFRVILVDSRPLLEGRELLKVLSKAGIECTYIFLNSLSYVMKEVTKVFMGAAALMTDGSILSRVGTANVALMAQSNNVPVLFCCETYKISSRVQLESITSNELGNPDALISTNCAIDRSGSKETNGNDVLNEWRSVESLRLLNLLYDLTPSEFASGIITELGILPPTSVAVLLRELNQKENDLGSSNI